MKKHLFLIASVFATVSLQAQVIVNVAADTGVKIKESTLFYVDGQMKVANYSGVGNKKISNQGNVKITKNLVNGNNTDGSNFVNEYFGPGKYGQLIINSDVTPSKENQNEGKIKSVIKLNGNFVYHSLAIPYEGITAIDVVNQLYPNRKADVEKSFVGYRYKNAGKKYFDRNRIKNPLFTWDNNIDAKAQEHNYMRDLAKTEAINPTAYYAINKGSALGEFSTSAPSSIQGKPAKEKYQVNLVKYTIGKSLETNNVGEYYGSYIYDYTQVMPTHWSEYDYNTEESGVEAGTFGSNIFNIANPYTSNINLYELSSDFLNKVDVLVQYTSQNYDQSINSGGASGAYGSTVFSAFVPGDATGRPLAHVRPFQTFSVKMKKDFQSVSFEFNDAVKTFDVEAGTPNVLYEKGLDRPVVNQVGLDVVNANGVLVGEAYVVASDIYEAAQKGQGTEVYNIALDDKAVGVYTLQENEDGTVNEALSENKSYINGVNADKYIAKPIHVVFQNGKGQYTLKARLNENLKNNKNAFYFEDKSTGKIQKITKGFEYTFNANGTEKDRFVLYWAATPNSEKVEEVAKQEVSTTVVFKDVDTYKVRFDKEIKKADVFVYNISGQLVNTSRNVDASVDYIVPLRGNSSVYIIKVIGDNGQVVTKKIVK